MWSPVFAKLQTTEISLMINPHTLDFLRSPISHDPLELRETSEGKVLIGKDSGDIFEIRESIPVLVDPSTMSEANKKSRRFYDLLAPFYEFSQSIYYAMNGGEENSRDEYLKYTGVNKGDRVLEVSIGNGVNLKFLPRNADYFGIDVSWGQLKRCQRTISKHSLNVEIFLAEAEHLPFIDGIFDVVFNVGSINYFEDKQAAIKEMLRVAKPGASLLIADETEKSARTHNRLPIYRGFFNSFKDPVVPPRALLPSEVEQVRLTEIRGGAYYCLQFRKSE